MAKLNWRWGVGAALIIGGIYLFDKGSSQNIVIGIILIGLGIAFLDIRS